MTWRIFSQTEMYQMWVEAYPKLAEMVQLMFELLDICDEQLWDKYEIAYGCLDRGVRAGLLTLEEKWDIQYSMEEVIWGGVYKSRK